MQYFSNEYTGAVRFAENSNEEVITGLRDIIDWCVVVHIAPFTRLHAKLLA